MYESFFSLRESPFSLVPDPEYLYLSRFHRKGLNMLELAMRDSAMFTLISGEVGSGKTTLVRKFLGMLDDNVSIGLITNTHESAGNMTQWILRSFGLRFGNDDAVALYDRFQEFLFEQYENQRKTMLIIDEAQNLSPAALEELRMLSNINTEKDLALQIVLVGQPEILEKINLPELRQLAQRISVNFRLEPLSFVETCHYIRHRIKVAGGRPDIFDLEACAAVYLFSEGIPRVINMICEMAMIYAYGDGRQTISAETILDVVDERRRSGIGGMSSLTKAYDRTKIEGRIRDLIEQESAAEPEPLIAPDDTAPDATAPDGVAPDGAAPDGAAETGSPSSPFGQRRSAMELPDREWEPSPRNEQASTRASVLQASGLKPVFAESEAEQEPPPTPTHGEAKRPSFPFSRRRSAMELPDRKWEPEIADEEAPMQASVLQAPHLKPVFAESQAEQEPPPPSIQIDPSQIDPSQVDPDQVDPGKNKPGRRRRFLFFALLIIGVGILGIYPFKSFDINKLPDLLRSAVDPGDGTETEVAPGEETPADLVEASSEQKDTGSSEAMPSATQDEPGQSPAQNPTQSNDLPESAAIRVADDLPPASDERAAAGDWVSSDEIAGGSQAGPEQISALPPNGTSNQPAPAVAVDDTPVPEAALGPEPTAALDTIPEPQAVYEPEPEPDRLEQVFTRYENNGTLELALTSLFKTWGFDYQTLPGNAPCAKARFRGLACVEGQGDWDTLYRFNKPTLLRLLSDENTVLYVVVSRLNDESAVLSLGEKSYRIARPDLDAVWNGSYLILRRDEIPFSRTLLVGTRGTDVNWVRHNLSEIYSAGLSPGDRYDAALRSLVTRFQRDNDLRQDGIFGPRTHSRLIEVIRAMESPLLIQNGVRQG